jgi:hypothetical protein
MKPAFLAHHVTAMQLSHCAVLRPQSLLIVESDLAMSSTRAKWAYNSTEEYEERVQAAKSGWLEGQFNSIRGATHAHDVGQSPFI